MPWRSKKQAAWGHTPEGERALGGPSAVAEWDSATRGKKLPERANSQKDHHMSQLRQHQEYARTGVANVASTAHAQENAGDGGESIPSAWKPTHPHGKEIPRGELPEHRRGHGRTEKTGYHEEPDHGKFD